MSHKHRKVQYLCMSLNNCLHRNYTCLLLLIGPYTNVLDLYLFPSMSHRHSAVLQRISNKELPLDFIWKTVDDVWKDTVSAEVARSNPVNPNLTLTLILTLNVIATSSLTLTHTLGPLFWRFASHHETNYSRTRKQCMVSTRHTAP